MKTGFYRKYFRLNHTRLIHDDSCDDCRDECCIALRYNIYGSTATEARTDNALGSTEALRYRQHVTLRPNFRKGIHMNKSGEKQP
jgi:hypothetical protein